MNTFDLKELKLKRDDAITDVKRNLRRYAEIKLYPKVFEDRVESYASFIINVENIQPGRNSSDLKLLRALSNEESNQKFEKKYDYLLSCLCDESNEYIVKQQKVMSENC